MQRFGYDDGCAVLVAGNPDVRSALQGHGQAFIHAADLPGVVAGVYILVHPQTVARSGQEFPAFPGLAQAHHLTGGVDAAGQVPVFQHIAVLVGRNRGFLAPACVRAHKAAALGRNGAAPVGAFPAKMVVHHFGILGGADDLGLERLRTGRNAVQRRFRLLMHPVDAGTGGDVVELLEQQGLPQVVDGFHFRPGAHEQRPGLVVLRQLQGDLCLADAPLGTGLGGQSAPVPGKVQLAAVYVFHSFLPVEESAGAFQAAAGSAFQIQAAPDGFHHIPGGAAAAVTVAVGEEHGIHALLLDPVFLPAGDQILRPEDGVVLFENVGQHPAAVQTLPPEQVVGEGISLRILPQQLLGGKVGHLTFFQNLGQGGGEAEGIRHPGHPAVRTQLPAVPALAPHGLADQALAGGDVGVGLHPHGAIGIELALTDALLHPAVQVGIKGFQIFQNGGLTQQEPVFRVFLHQIELVGIGAGGFAHGLGHRPQPGKIQVGLAEHREFRCGRAVGAGKQRFQNFVRFRNALGQPRLRQLKVCGKGELFQTFQHLHGPQAPIRQLFQQAVEGAVVHSRLKDRFIPHTDVGVGERDLCFRGLGHGGFSVPHGACPLIAQAVARVALGIDAVSGSGLRLPGQREIVVLLIDGTGHFSVYKHQHFRPGAQHQYQRLAGKSLRHGKAGAEPAVFPFLSPFHSHRGGTEGAFLCLSKGHLLHGGEKFHIQSLCLAAKNLIKLFRPDFQTVGPLSAHINHCRLPPVFLESLLYYHITRRMAGEISNYHMI